MWSEQGGSSIAKKQFFSRIKKENLIFLDALVKVNYN